MARKKSVHILVGLNFLAVLIFILLSTPNLKAQGLYYDEAHQATASFAYIGRPAYQWTTLTISGIPVLNMSYSGAIKSAIYGLQMKILSRPFSVKSWRLLGIAFVSFGLLLFGWITRQSLSWKNALIFYGLFLSDTTLLLTTRHDWGPTALALALRLILIATILQDQERSQPRLRTMFLIGLLIGFSTFEKLNNFLLLIPVLLIFFTNAACRKNPRQWLALMIGGVTGGLPLLLANIYTLIKNGQFISLAFTPNAHVITAQSFVDFIYNFLALGSGNQARSFILGSATPSLSSAEATVMVATLLISSVWVIQRWKASSQARVAGVLLGGYFLIGICLPALPMTTWIHHWVMATPFQYAAIALAIPAIFSDHQIPSPTKLFTQKTIITLLILLFSVIRFTGLIKTEASLIHGDYSNKWNPSLTEAAQFAADHRSGSIFISANWGIAAQIFCISNGNGNDFYIPIWQINNMDSLQEIFTNSPKNIAYIYFYTPNGSISNDQQLVLNQLISSLNFSWRLQPVEETIGQLNNIKIIKLVNITEHP